MVRLSLLWPLLWSCTLETGLGSQVPDVVVPPVSPHAEAVYDLLPDLKVPQRDGVGGVTGLICTPSGDAPVVGAVVWVEIGSERLESTTGVDGRFVLEGLPVGVHELTAEKGSFLTTFAVQIAADQIVELAVDECLDGDIDIAVVAGMFDAIESVLDDLSLDYTLYPALADPSTTALLRDPIALAEVDILLINCDLELQWTSYRHEIVANLDDFVQNGGSLYVSDWSAFVVESIFPDMIDFVGDDMDPFASLLGPSGVVQARVLDPVFAI
jgi:hypothetical protein